MTAFIRKTFVCRWNLLFTKGPFLGKNYLGYKENQETPELWEVARPRSDPACCRHQRPTSPGTQTPVHEQQPGQGGVCFGFNTYVLAMDLKEDFDLPSRAQPKACGSLCWPSGWAWPAVASLGPFSAGGESSLVLNSLGPAGGLSEGLCQEQHRKNLNEVPMNGESHLDGIALGIK